MTRSAGDAGFWFAYFAVLGACSWWIAAGEMPCPRGDDAFYKAPGVELVQHGLFASPSATGYLPRVERIFACYPPLYAFVFAGWVKLFGFSLASSTAFNHSLHLAGVALLVWAASSLIREFRLARSLRILVPATLGLIHYGDMRFFDRQEELALAFLWIEIALHSRGLLTGVRGAGVTGLLVGLAGFVGPWPGLLVGGSVVLRELLTPSSSGFHRVARLITISAAAALPLGVWVGWLQWSFPGLPLLQFREHVAHVPHLSALQDVNRFMSSLSYAPYQLPAVLLALMLVPRCMFKSDAPRIVPAMTIVAVAGLVVAALWRADSYVYVWSSLTLLLPPLAYAVARGFAEAKSSIDSSILAAMFLACGACGLRDPASLAVLVRTLPAEERAAQCFARLREIIPVEATVATTPRHWHLFQGRNRWRQVAILASISDDERRKWDFIVLPTDSGTPEFRLKLLDGFRLVERIPMYFEPFAPTFQRDELTWAYEVFRREK